MKILDAKFVQDFIKMADDGYQQGWHERNGGNLSYRIKPEEVEIIRNRLDEEGEWTPIGVSVPDLAGEFFMVTGTYWCQRAGSGRRIFYGDGNRKIF